MITCVQTRVALHRWTNWRVRFLVRRYGVMFAGALGVLQDADRFYVVGLRE